MLDLKKTQRAEDLEPSDWFKDNELVVEVPGVKKDDINVEVRGECRVLNISGKKMINEDKSEIESKFEKSFMLGTLFDTTKITVTLENGVLTVVAPKVTQEDNVQKIEITEA